MAPSGLISATDTTPVDADRREGAAVATMRAWPYLHPAPSRPRRAIECARRRCRPLLALTEVNSPGRRQRLARRSLDPQQVDGAVGGVLRRSGPGQTLTVVNAPAGGVALTVRSLNPQQAIGAVGPNSTGVQDPGADCETKVHSGGSTWLAKSAPDRCPRPNTSTVLSTRTPQLWCVAPALTEVKAPDGGEALSKRSISPALDTRSVERARRTHVTPEWFRPALTQVNVARWRSQIDR